MSTDDTVRAVVDESFSEFGSFAEVTLAVLLKTVTAGVAAGMLPTSGEVIEAPAASAPMLQSIVAPTVQPALGLIETKVIVAGSVSRRWTPLASEGPPFVTTIVYVTSLPAAAAEGPSLVTETSACVD